MVREIFKVCMLMSINVFIVLFLKLSLWIVFLAPKPKVRKDLISPPGGAVAIQVKHRPQDEENETIAPLSWNGKYLNIEALQDLVNAWISMTFEFAIFLRSLIWSTIWGTTLAHYLDHIARKPPGLLFSVAGRCELSVNSV